MDDLEIVYALRRRINRLEQKLKSLTCENVHSDPDTNRQTVARINKIEAQIIKLKGIHYDQIIRIYSHVGNRPKTAPVIIERQMKITEIDVGDKITTLKMTPTRFKLDDRKTALKDIIYPIDGTDRNLVNTIARYRTITNKSKDFLRNPLQVNQNSIETVIIALDSFVRQFGGELSFTNEDLSFSDCAKHAACGVINLGSIHLLAADYIPTAKFSLKFNLNYDRDVAQSTSIMKHFIFDFNKSLAQLLHCKNEFIRIFSIEKLDHKRGMIQINFGLTTPDRKQTESLARHFQTLLRRSDFRNEKILRFIQSDRYQYKLISVVSYLQLSSKDFNTHDSINYTSTSWTEEEQGGNHPSGWFRHALNLTNKYSDNDIWLGCQDIDGEWPVAFHGTYSQTITGITRADFVKRDDEEQKGTTVPAAGLYVSTRCNGGVDEYTTPVTASNGDQNETFRLVFQCRVRPDSFTTHTDMADVWRIVDPQAIRPYGLLLKNETILS